jgi:DNA-binding MurR/RpiR family transcriptional regulator
MSRLPILLSSMMNTVPEDSINYVLAEAVLKKIYKNDFKDVSVISLAKDCNVSKASVSRFFRALGYEDYMDFKLDFLYMQRNMKNEWLPNTIYPNMNTSNIKESYLQAVTNSIHQLEKNIGEKDLKKVAKYIYEYKQVVLMGHMQSGYTALAMQQYIQSSNKRVEVILNPTEQKEYFIKNKEAAFVIIFSSGGHFFDRFTPNWNLQLSSKMRICVITTNSQLKEIPGVDILINSHTTEHFAAGNISLEFIAKLIVLYYKSAR